MTTGRTWLAAGVLLFVAQWTAVGTAASSSAQHPRRVAIVITSPRDGSVIQSSTLTVTVEVFHFRLVPPVLQNPPILPPDSGHIQYVLDGPQNFDPHRDITDDVVHTWTDVAPGRHRVIAYLATSQHIQVPGTEAASVTVDVVRPPGEGGGMIVGPAGVFSLGLTGGAAGLNWF